MTVTRKLLSFVQYVAALAKDGKRWEGLPERVYDIPSDMLPRGL